MRDDVLDRFGVTSFQAHHDCLGRHVSFPRRRQRAVQSNLEFVYLVQNSQVLQVLRVSVPRGQVGRERRFCSPAHRTHRDKDFGCAHRTDGVTRRRSYADGEQVWGKGRAGELAETGQNWRRDAPNAEMTACSALGSTSAGSDSSPPTPLVPVEITSVE